MQRDGWEFESFAADQSLLLRASARYAGTALKPTCAASSSPCFGMLIGYPLSAFVGYWAIGFFSGNHFDGSVEAGMTAAFVFGPLGAIVGIIASAVLGRPKRASSGKSN
jgi:hypothetical protein